MAPAQESVASPCVCHRPNHHRRKHESHPPHLQGIQATHPDPVKTNDIKTPTTTPRNPKKYDKTYEPNNVTASAIQNTFMGERSFTASFPEPPAASMSKPQPAQYRAVTSDPHPTQCLLVMSSPMT